MNIIYKYPLAITDRQVLKLPFGAEILTVQDQYGLQLWAEVSPEAPKVDRVVVIVGTGNPVPEEPLLYITTVQKNGFVWHVFEARP